MKQEQNVALLERVAVLERAARNSIDFKLSAKGDPYWEITIRFEDGYEEEAVERIKLIDAKLRAWQEAKP